MAGPGYTSFAPPAIDLAAAPPLLQRRDYESRIDAIRAASRAHNYDYLVVYGDREHFANLRFACGYDPRFEEGLFVAGLTNDEPVVIVGNEGLEYVRASPAQVQPVLCQALSLMGQDRTEQPSLAEAFRESGLQRGSSVGLVGWKYFGPSEGPANGFFAVPAFVISALAEVITESGSISDATPLFIDPVDGLRAHADAATIAELEYGAALAGEHVQRVVDGFEIGMTELEAACLMQLNGYPLTCHPMVIAGRHDFVGMRSPSGRVIQSGDVLSVAVGLWGGLTARAGIVAGSETELDEKQRGYSTVAAEYFSTIRAWYRALGIGAKGRDVAAAVARSLEEASFSLLLNPGHLTHYDEWVHTPMVPTEERALKSGMILQCDMIPATDPSSAFCNCEDTLCLANAELRGQLSATYPKLMQRIERRREILSTVLGEEPAEEILPLTNIPAYFRPLLLRRGEALTFS